MIIKTDNQNYFDIAAAIREKGETVEAYKPSEMALAITNIESGGISCTLTISTAPNAIVIATFENQTITAIADVSGTAILELSKEGVWTVTASFEGETTSMQVDTSFSVAVELSFIDPVLANNTWEQISKVARSGKASQYWNIGDTKPIMRGSETYTVQIIDFDHYEVEDPAEYGRTKAGIVFQFVEASTDAYKFPTSSATNEANNKVIDNLECKNYVPTIKYPSLHSNTSSDDPSNIYTDTAKDIFPSEREIFGTAGTNEKTPVGTQFAFYAAGNSPQKKVNGINKADWWTRSYGRYSGYRVYVKQDGTSGTAVGSSTSKRIAPVFCL